MQRHRFYTFVNRNYMSPVQWGIQTAHCVSSMMSAAVLDNAQAREAPMEGAGLLAQAMRWAVGEPTLMVMAANNVAELLELKANLAPLCNSLGLPFASFCEDMASLNGAITCVGFLLPEELFTLQMKTDAFGKVAFHQDPESACGAPAGGLPLTRESNQEAFDLLIVAKTARFAA